MNANKERKTLWWERFRSNLRSGEDKTTPVSITPAHSWLHKREEFLVKFNKFTFRYTTEWCHLPPKCLLMGHGFCFLLPGQYPYTQGLHQEWSMSHSHPRHSCKGPLRGSAVWRSTQRLPPDCTDPEVGQVDNHQQAIRRNGTLQLWIRATKKGSQ